jgi:hypothetical protein
VQDGVRGGVQGAIGSEILTVAVRECFDPGAERMAVVRRLVVAGKGGCKCGGGDRDCEDRENDPTVASSKPDV